jgi:GntR family transcriptional repressor for pyruvate dehydrogenase complex
MPDPKQAGTPRAKRLGMGAGAGRSRSKSMEVDLDWLGLVAAARPKHERIADVLRLAIQLGWFAEQVPPERSLAAQLDVSRETVRRALALLLAGGDLTLVRGSRGELIVAGDSVSGRRRRTRLSRERQELLQLLEFRTLNECFAVRVACRRRTDRDLQGLRNAIVGMADARSLGAFRRYDSAFHIGIARCTRDQLICDTIIGARAAMFEVLDVLDPAVPGRAAVAQHERILHHIERREGEQATAAVREHIETTRRDAEVALSI